MRSSDALAITGPASLSTSFATGVSGCAASAMPIRPPIEVPTQCTLLDVQARDQRHHVGDVLRQL